MQLGARQAVRVAGRPVYYRPQVSMRWDGDAIAEAYARAAGKVDYDGRFIPAANIARTFKTPSESRPLRIY